MRLILLVSLIAFGPLSPSEAAQIDLSRERGPSSQRIEIAQSGTWQAKSVRRRPATYARPGYRPRPGYRAAYRPGGRPGYYRPGYRPRPGYGWRPPYPGWAPAPWYGSYWRPGYGWAAAAGIIAVGVLAASAASAYSVPPPPNPAYCWFYTDQTYQTGYWAPCP